MLEREVGSALEVIDEPPRRRNQNVDHAFATVKPVRSRVRI